MNNLRSSSIDAFFEKIYPCRMAVDTLYLPISMNTELGFLDSIRAQVTLFNPGKF